MSDFAKDTNVPNNDCISRQAVADWLQRWVGYLDNDMIARMQYRVVDIPSAEPEIIRCKDCKHLDTHNHRCKVWNHGVYVWFDFCSRAERKEDE